MTRADDAGPKVIAARAENWHCELCARTHPVGEHDPGVSWPQPTEAPQPQPRSGQSAGPVLRCLCGISLWATEKTAKPNVWARHIAHTRAFQDEMQQRLWSLAAMQPAAEWNRDRAYRKACESMETSPVRDGDQPGGRCLSCDQPVAARIHGLSHVLVHVVSPG